MASLVRGNTDDARRTALSPRPKGRESAKDTLCRNVTIYGHCRYENKGCAFNHDPTKGKIATDSAKKRFNVDSPSFTPAVQAGSSLAVNGSAFKVSGISPKAANAAPFKPKGVIGGSDGGLSAENSYNPAAADWSLAPAADMQEFVPQNISQNIEPAMDGHRQKSLSEHFRGVFVSRDPVKTLDQAAADENVCTCTSSLSPGEGAGSPEDALERARKVACETEGQGGRRALNAAYGATRVSLLGTPRSKSRSNSDKVSASTRGAIMSMAFGKKLLSKVNESSPLSPPDVSAGPGQEGADDQSELTSCSRSGPPIIFIQEGCLNQSVSGEAAKPASQQIASEMDYKGDHEVNHGHGVQHIGDKMQDKGPLSERNTMHGHPVSSRAEVAPESVTSPLQHTHRLSGEARREKHWWDPGSKIHPNPLLQKPGYRTDFLNPEDKLINFHSRSDSSFPQKKIPGDVLEDSTHLAHFTGHGTGSDDDNKIHSSLAEIAEAKSLASPNLYQTSVSAIRPPGSLKAGSGLNAGAVPFAPSGKVLTRQHQTFGGYPQIPSVDQESVELKYLLPTRNRLPNMYSAPKHPGDSDPTSKMSRRNNAHSEPLGQKLSGRRYTRSPKTPSGRRAFSATISPTGSPMSSSRPTGQSGRGPIPRSSWNDKLPSKKSSAHSTPLHSSSGHRTPTYGYKPFLQGETDPSLQQAMYSESFAASTPSLGTSMHGHQQATFPYASDPQTNIGSQFYSSNSTADLQYHLYTPFGPRRENLNPNQRAAQDFFIPEQLREELQRKSAATQQIIDNAYLNHQISRIYHSLVMIDTKTDNNAALFGFPSQLFKAMSNKDGKHYALRRIPGFRLTNDQPMRSVEKWKKINNANIVTFVQAFTTSDFGSSDRSLVYVTEFHPCSKTLEETHFPVKQNGYRSPGRIDREVLWGYLIQLCSALKTIHDNKLAARLIDASKILVTGKNRIRLNACGLLDIVQSETPKTLLELQNEDLIQLGILILTLGTSPAAIQSTVKALEQFERSYGAPFKEIVIWLLSKQSQPQTGTIDDLISGIGPHIMSDFNASLNLCDDLEANLNRELENSRITRLMIKLNFINERPEYLGNPQWSETGERYPIKLFRDYMFHQVDADGYPVLDLAHVIACLNKLDAGIDEKMVLTTRNDETIIVVSYKEMKRAISRAYEDLASASKRKAGY